MKKVLLQFEFVKFWSNLFLLCHFNRGYKSIGTVCWSNSIKTSCIIMCWKWKRRKRIFTTPFLVLSNQDHHCYTYFLLNVLMSSDAESSILMYVNYMYIYTVPGGYLSLSAFLFAFLPSDFGFATLFSFQTEVRRLRSLILSKKVPKCICCFNYIYFLRQYFQISTFRKKGKKGWVIKMFD